MDPLARKLIKIIRNGDEWRFTWSAGPDIHTLKANERPLPDLPQSLEGLVNDAIASVGFIDKSYHKKVVVQGLTCDWKGDDARRNAVIHLFVDKGSEGVCDVNTPKRLADTSMKEAKKARWDINVVKTINNLEEAAFSYIDGNRSQQTMPLISGDKKKNGKKDDETSLDEELAA